MNGLNFFWCSDDPDCNFPSILHSSSVRTSNFMSIGQAVVELECDKPLTFKCQFSPYTLPRASYPQSHPPSPLLHPHNSPVTPMTARSGEVNFECVSVTWILARISYRNRWPAGFFERSRFSHENLDFPSGVRECHELFRFFRVVGWPGTEFSLVRIYRKSAPVKFHVDRVSSLEDPDDPAP